MNIKNWISAFRLKTIPLALASMLLGNFLAYSLGEFSFIIAALSILTCIALQILSNLANDYGDAVNGVDNEYRVGPARAVQSGLISPEVMKKGIYFFIALSLLFGLGLLYFSFKEVMTLSFLLFFILGVFAIAAAIKYTVGKNPYGYNGLGDVFVLLFFGWIAVLGTVFLHRHAIEILFFLPATSIGLLAVGVLNLNNMRDANQDKEVGKNTLAIKLGENKVKAYHTALIIIAMLCAVLFAILTFQSAYQWLFLISFIPLSLHIKRVLDNKIPAHLDPELKKLALSTLFFSILFGIAICLRSF
ncbi:MAG: 1,4-dihydroxy-2-naphthoate polyprenyltransferase [Bacteroidota bacterium]